MINKTVSFISEQLNHSLQLRFSKDESLVVGSGLTEAGGGFPDAISERVVITLINIEHEHSIVTGSPRMQTSHEGFARTTAPLHLNLLLLLSASFKHYPTSLEYLSAVLGFFQAHPLFTAEASQNFPSGLEQLAFDPVNLDLQALSNVWSVVGGRHLPSVMYKARLMTTQDAWVLNQVPEIKGVDTKL